MMISQEQSCSGLLLALVLVGCMVPPGSGGQSAWNQPAGQPGVDDCSRGCDHLAMCQTCLRDNAGQCMDAASCAQTCRTTQGGLDAARCVLGVTNCDGNALNSCVGQGAPAAQGTGKSKDCDGCAWDGSACTWFSQSNWGPGPYSGAAAPCDPSCCR
ncbi:MAG: hypothetical protein MUF54_20805 [Polyangiaceae bacterium]|nr:hypothetical protein [Polyangiaceae bacterium]